MANKNKFNTSIPSNRKTRLNTKSNSWLSNAAKSLGYSSLDVLSEILPNTINMSKNALESSQDLINDFKDFKTVKSRLSQTMENNVYLDLMKEWKTNAVDDLKTGKFYNKERQDEAFNEDIDMDFDVGDDSDFDSSMSSKDGSTSVSMTRKSGDNQEVDMITVNTNINGDNPMVGAVQNQTKLAIQSSSASMELSKRNQLMTIQALQQMGQNVGGLLTSINSNVISISKDTTEMLSRHLSISSKYYDDSMKLFTDIHKELQDMNSKTKLSGDVNNPNVKVREYQDVMDIFSGGSVDFKAYMGLVKKQWETTSDSNLFLSAFKNIASQPDVLGMMAKNPLKFVADSAIKKVIPGMVKQAAGDFDNTLGEAIVSKLHQVSNLQNSNNPLLEIIGKVFGISNKKISYDKTQYEKGKVDWNGISHRTLNDVIPFYLRKILAAVSSGQEIGFDYNRGEYKLVNDLVKDQKQDMESRLLSPLSGMIGEFKDFLGQMKFSTDGERTEVEDSFKKLSLDLVKSDGGKNFRRVYDKKTNTYRDDIASSLNKSSDDAIVQLIRGFFQGSKNSDVMRFFNSDVLSAKAGYSKLMNDMMLNPMQYNAHYMDLGVGEADKFLKFDKRTGRKVIGKKKGGTGFGSDNYSKTPTDYLHSILDTLNRGLKVAVVNYNDITGEHTSSRRKRGTITGYSTMYNDIVAKSQGKLDKLKEDSDDYSKIKYKDKRDRTGKVLSREELDKYRLKGKHVVSLTDDDTNETIAKSVREDQIRRDYEKEQETTLSKVGALAPSSSLNKLIYKFSTYIDKPGQVMKDFFNKADDFVFKLVFGEDKTDSNNSLLARSFEYMEKTFAKFSLWLDEKVLEPLNESLFGDNGLITNLKNSKMFNDMKGYMSNIRDSLLGTKNEDNIREGGLLSGLSNEFKATFGLVKQAILGGKVKDAHGNWIEQTSPSVLDHVKTIGKNVGSTLGEMFGIQRDPSKQSSGNAFIDGVDNVWTTVKNRTSLVLDDILGPASDDPTSKRNRVNLFMKETKDSLPKTLAYGTIGAGASLGLGFLGSWFLPGGPIGGALLGAGVGLVSGSESLKTTLFGDLIDDGKGGKERAGAIINKQTQDFFKKHGKGSLLGAGLGAMATSQLGFLGGMFTPLGPIGGALLGSGISLATKTDAFQEFLWGTEDKDGNTIKKGILGSLKNKANKGSFSDKFIDAGIGAGVGLMGSFFLPGGPVMGAMLGAIGNLTLNSEGAKTFLFGDKNEKGERVGGLVGSVKSWMSDNMGKPMAKTFEKAQIEVGHFIRNNMVLPFTKALDPLKEEFFRVQERMATGFKNVMESFKDNANKSFEKFFGKPLGDFMRDNVLNPIKGILGKIFGGIGKVVGTIAASPFKLLNTVADGLFQKHQKEGKQAFIEDGVQNLIGKSAKEKRKQDGVTRKAFSTYDYDGNKIGGGVLGDLGQLLSRKNYKEAANSEKGAVYNKDNKWVEANRLREKEERDRYQKELLDYEYKWQNDGEKQHKTPYQMQLEKEKKSTTQTTTTKPNQTKVSEADSAIAESVDSNGNKVRFVSDKFSTLKEYYNRASSGTRLKLGKSKDSIVSGNKVLSNKVVSGNLTKPTIKDNQTKLSTEVDDRTQAVSEMDKKINKAKVVSTKLSQSQRDSLLKNIEGYTKVIATEVRGQLDGLGSNVYKLRKIVQTKLGVDDEDVKGSGNRDRLGFFGKLKRGIKNPIEFMKDLTMKPIDGLVNLYHKGLDKLTSLFKLPKKIIGSLFKGLEVLGKGIWDVTTSLLKVPEFLAKSLYEVLKVVGPVVKEAFVNTIKFAGTALVEGTKFVGTMLTKTVSTVGGVLVGAAKGIGSTIGTILKTTASVIGGGLVVAKDAIVEGSKLLLQGVGMVGNALMTTISAPFKLAGKVLGWDADKLTDKSKLIQRVQVIGGTLDEVKVIREIKGSGDTNQLTKPNLTKLSTDDDGKINNTRVSKTTDNMNTALTIQAEKAKEEKYQSEIKANRKDYNYFASKDAEQDKAIEDEKKRSTLFGKLTELTSVTKEHALNWASMFGKKGLISAGLLLGLPVLYNFFKNFSWDDLIDKLKNLNPFAPIEEYDNSRRNDPDNPGELIENKFYKKAKTKAMIDAPRTIYKVGKMLTPKPVKTFISKGMGIAKDFKPTNVNKSNLSTVEKFVNGFRKCIDTFLNNSIVTKVLGKETIDNVRKKIPKLLEVMTNTMIQHFPSLSAKLARLGTDATWVIPPLGLTIDVVFGVADAITGFADASKIFRVSKDDVTFGMRVIASLTKVLVGWNGMVDLGNEIISIVTDGVGFRELLSDWLYEEACKMGSVFGGDEANALDAKQEANKIKYKKYNEQLEYEGKDQIGYSAYLDKMEEGAWSKTKRFTSNAWDNTKKWTSETWDKTKAWSSNAWDKTKKFGGETFNTLSGNLFNADGVRTSLGLTDDQNVSLRDRLSATYGSIVSLISGGKLDKNESAKAIYALTEDAMQYGENLWTDISSWTKTKYTEFKDNAAIVGDNFNRHIGGMLGLVDDEGNPLPFTSTMKDIITKNVRSTIDQTIELKNNVVNSMKILKDNTIELWNNVSDQWSNITDKFNRHIGAMFGFVDDEGKPMSFTTKMSDVKSKTLKGISDTVTYIREEASRTWDRVKTATSETMSSLMDNIKNLPSAGDKMLGSLFGLADEKGNKLGLVEWMGQKVTDTTSKARGWWSNLSNRGTELINKRNNGGYGELGGFGGDDDFTYYSQNDPRYANNPYYTSGGQSDGGVPQTIGKRGCGPTSLAMVASELTGQQIDPVTLSNVATNEGYSTTMGTHPDYFRNIGSKFGLNVNETSTSEGAIKSSLASGQPVILQGVSQGEDTSAFTSAGHYVVATKTDGDNVMVNDPRGKRYSKTYNINQLVKESAKMWSFGTTGMGPAFDYTGTSIKTQNPLYNMHSSGLIDNPFIESRPVIQDISVGPGTVGPSVGQSVVDIANQFIGRPYIWGAEGSPDWNNDGEASDGFDCSGLVSHALNFAGVKNYGRLTASDFFRKATPVNKSSLIPGDLGFVSSGGSITHVGIYAGNDEWIEAMGSAEQVVRVPSNRASKWTSYGRLKEVNDLANIDSSYLDYGQTSVSYAEENKPTSFFGGILDIVSNNVNKFFGFNSESSSSPNVGNIYPMYGDGQLSSTQASSLRDAVNKKTRELLVQSESGGNYAIAKNDKSSATGNSISPSIGVLQWRGSYADQLMSRMSQALPNDPEAKYFDSINWSTEANKGPWSSNQLDRYKNFMTRNANISKSVQDKYAEEYIDDRLTSNLFKHMVGPGLIKDPRSMVLLNDISQTGPAHIGTFASKYNRTIPSGLNEFNHVFNEVTSDKSYWGRHMSTYKNRFNKNKDSLQNWQVSLPGYSNPIKTKKSQAKLDKMNSQGGPTVMGMGGLLSKVPKKIKSHNTPVLMGMGGLDKYNKKPKYTKTSRVDKTYSRESSNVKIKDTIQQGFGTVADERIIKLLTTMVDYLKDTKDGIKEFNDKDFSNNNKSVIQYVDSSNNVVSNNSNTVNGKKTTKKVDNKTDNRSYNKAKAIAGGLII